MQIEGLLSAIRREAERAPFPVDEPVYRENGREPAVPILFAGSLEAPVAFLGRDLGREEVSAGEPLIGPAGRLVRAGVHRAAGGTGEPDAEALARAAKRVLLTNTVPYKPPGNKAYAEEVKRRFRPFVALLLAGAFSGGRVITLGTEAFRWFEPWAGKKRLDAAWEDEERRYGEAEIEVEIAGELEGERIARRLVVLPLPHPSPLNQRWYRRFPELLDRRLSGVWAGRPGAGPA